MNDNPTVFVPDFNTRNKKRGVPGPDSPHIPRAAVPKPAAPAAPQPVTIGKGKAVDLAKDAGLDPKELEAVLESWLSTGAITKDSNTWVIPEDMVTRYIGLKKAGDTPGAGGGEGAGNG